MRAGEVEGVAQSSIEQGRLLQSWTQSSSRQGRLLQSSWREDKPKKRHNASLRWGWATGLEVVGARAAGKEVVFLTPHISPPAPSLLLLLQLESGQPHLILMRIVTIWWQFGAQIKCIELPAKYHFNLHLIRLSSLRTVFLSIFSWAGLGKRVSSRGKKGKFNT